jgi:type III restriction enzyme
MAPKFRFQFDANQEHQLTAVESITALFEGFTRQEADFHLGDEIVANLPPYDDLAEIWLLSNLQAVQEHNRLAQQMFLDFDSGMGLAGISDENHRFPHFTVEMETGTGKTYVYLRTIYELRRRCGWSKFVVVVPSIAIYEGVIKNAQVTRGPFRALYGNEPFDPDPLTMVINSVDCVTLLLPTRSQFCCSPLTPSTRRATISTKRRRNCRANACRSSSFRRPVQS